MNPNLKIFCFLIWDAFALFALIFTLSMLAGLHPALLIAAEFIVVFLFLAHRAVTWMNVPQKKENPSALEVFRTAFWHCLRGFALFVVLFWFVLYVLSLL